jgi:hypothetical protein
MATSRKSASHRTKAAKSRSGPKPAKRPAAAARRPDAKPMKKPTAKPVAASGKIKGKPVLVAKSAGGKGAARGVTLNPGALKAAALAAARKAYTIVVVSHIDSCCLRRAVRVQATPSPVAGSSARTVGSIATQT